MLRVLGGTGVAALSGLAGCSSGNGTQSQSATQSSTSSTSAATSSSSASGPVKVGFLHPLSGPLSGLGKVEQKGAKVAVDHVNNDLGGIGGNRVRAIYEDTATSPSTGRQKARKLVESDGVDVLIGAVSGAVSLSVAEYAADANTVYFPYGGTESITGKNCKPTTFRYQYSASQSANAGAEWSLNNLGKNVWIHYADYSFGQSIRDTWEAAMKASGIDHTVVNVTKTKLGTSDFSSYISQIKSSKADWVLQAFSGADAINFLKQAKQYGMTDAVDVMSSVNSYLPLRQGAGSAAVGTYALIRYNRKFDSPANRKLVSAYTDAYGGPPTDFALNMWSSLLLYRTGVENAGSRETADVVPELAGLTSDQPMGPVTLRECDHQALRDYPVGKIVAPTDYDWPDLKIIETKKADQITPACDAKQCDMPSL